MQASALKRPPRLSASKRREAILDAALSLFGNQGFDRVSINEIATASGVTKPVLYDHFASKSELYIALLDREGARLLDAVRTALDLRRPLDERLRMMAEQTLRFVRQHRTAARLLLRTPEGDELTRAAHERIRAAAHRAGAAAILADPIFQPKHGLSRQASAALLAELHMALLEQTARWAINHPSTPIKALTEVFVDVLWNGLAHPAERA
jgi:AcrR family transcriptional regulator